jgi:hypothetical protein
MYLISIDSYKYYFFASTKADNIILIVVLLDSKDVFE